jgi:tetratricopeptide (TPR) repeat protein
LAKNSNNQTLQQVELSWATASETRRRRPFFLHQNRTRKVLSHFLLCLVAQVFFLATVAFALAQATASSDPAVQDDALQQALAALQQNRLDEALDLLATAERAHPSDARIRNFRGIVLMRLGKDDEAAREYRQAIQFDPGLEDAHKNLGYLEWSEHNLDHARAELNRALELAPDDSFARYYLGRVQLDAKLYESAFQELERSGLSWPADVPFLLEALTGYHSLGRQDKARMVIHRLSTVPLNDDEVAIVARLLASIDEKDSSIDFLRKLSGRHSPACPRWAQFDLALSYLLKGNFQDAIDQGRIFLQAPRFAEATPMEAASVWSILGVAQSRLKQSDAAIDAFREASKLDPSREEHWLNLTRELMDSNRYGEAISLTQDGLRANPKSYALHLRLGAAYLSSDRYSDAENVFRQLIAAGDPLPTSYVGLAQVLLRTGRAEEAVSELAAARQKLGASFLIRYFQGLALARAARPAEAISAFQDATRLNPNSPDAHLGLGKAELANGSVNDAIAELQKTLQLSPGNLQAQRLLSQAYGRAGDTRAASRYAEKSVESVSEPQADLLGDFVLPEWQVPQPSAGQ